MAREGAVMLLFGIEKGHQHQGLDWKMYSTSKLDSKSCVGVLGILGCPLVCSREIRRLIGFVIWFHQSRWSIGRGQHRIHPDLHASISKIHLADLADLAASSLGKSSKLQVTSSYKSHRGPFSNFRFIVPFR